MPFQREHTQNLLLTNNLILVHLELYFLQIKLIHNRGGFVVLLKKKMFPDNQITHTKKSSVTKLFKKSTEL